MDYIAHIRKSDLARQSVIKHLREVAEICKILGRKIGVAHLAQLAGLLHDMGKFTTKFKGYIELVMDEAEDNPRRGSVDHSTAGARLLYNRYYNSDSDEFDKRTVEWVANCIMSHHGGLRDFISPNHTSPFLERVTEKELLEYELAEREFFKHVSEDELDELFAKATAELKQCMETIEKYKLPYITNSLFIKFIFSCLIDADRTNTRIFEENGDTLPVINTELFFQRSYKLLMLELEKFKKDSKGTVKINKLRREMSLQCEKTAMMLSGIRTLSIPTGGGKTLASLRYALRHAMEYKKKRIIFIIPYTTIIEQNADEVRRILKEHDLILEHHSNVVVETQERDKNESGDVYSNTDKIIKLAQDTWDRPIIFTTMVQYLNTFYAKGTSNVRRLHQLSNSIIIFDEVQSVPIHCISLFNASLNFLHYVCNSSILLCTATQPALDSVKQKLHLSVNAEIVSDLSDVTKGFKRVEIHDYTKRGPWGAEKVASFIHEQMSVSDSLLVILNTKSAVSKLFKQLKLSKKDWIQDGNITLFHLSTGMCAAHRKYKLEKMKELLETDQRVICISTQLIEAGVDISFDCVIRSLAGLDSIAQAAGRCNRHGNPHDELFLGNVYIIRSADENLKHLPEIRKAGDSMQRVLEEYADDPSAFDENRLSAVAMRTYFSYYYHEVGDQMDHRIKQLQQNIFDLISENSYYHSAYTKWNSPDQPIYPMSLATAEQYFEVISQKTTPVLVPYNEEARSLIADLNGKDMTVDKLRGLLSKAQKYVVNLYDWGLKELDHKGDIVKLLHGQVFAFREGTYSDEMGIYGEGEMLDSII